MVLDSLLFMSGVMSVMLFHLFAVSEICRKRPDIDQ